MATLRPPLVCPASPLLPPGAVLPAFPQPSSSPSLRLVRNILADKPRVTRFLIPFDAVEEVLPVPADGMEGDESMLSLGGGGGAGGADVDGGPVGAGANMLASIEMMT